METPFKPADLFYLIVADKLRINPVLRKDGTVGFWTAGETFVNPGTGTNYVLTVAWGHTLPEALGNWYTRHYYLVDGRDNPNVAPPPKV